MNPFYTHHTIYTMLEISYINEIKASYAMYNQMVSVHYHFGFHSQTTSKDFIN
ncbi:hypothetical protein [Pedobacter cryoconitis]|uniref:Uncharacterized protein n=1 Tax=Pedobacter cryoconitis TaxID=188932 RepID=A0A7X0J6E1_9SPHI|nr:hypothetical protein [Pedobacter cryoconitis]MBB6501944.1 hypothetical protein [Pedobacter cryoconitis]